MKGSDLLIQIVKELLNKFKTGVLISIFLRKLFLWQESPTLWNPFSELEIIGTPQLPSWGCNSKHGSLLKFIKIN